MLRAKQIVPLSQSARTFFISGTSRSSPGDFSEDDSRRRQQQGNEFIPPNKAETRTLPSFAHVLSAPCSSLRSDGAILLNGDAHASQKVSDQFVKAGIAAVGLLTDVVNNKVPVLDVNGVLPSLQSRVVNSVRSQSDTISSDTKPHARENLSQFHVKPSSKIATSSKSNRFNGPRDRDEKSTSAKPMHQFSSESAAKSVQIRNEQSDIRNQRPSNPYRTYTSSYCSVSKTKSSARGSESNAIGGYAEDVLSPQKSTRTHQKPALGMSPLVKHFSNDKQVVERVYCVLQQFKWGPAAEKALGNLNCSLSAYQANQILKQVQDHAVALGFFYWLKDRAGYKHDGHSYTTMVGILGRARQFNAINRLLCEMTRDGCLPNVVTYNRLIHSYGRANFMDEAVNVFYKMQAAGCEPDRVTYSTLIDIHAKAGFLDVAMDLYRKMQEAGLSPDTFTYSVMINCLGKGGHLASSYQLFCEMVAEGCVPNLVTYNIMIALQAKARNYACALKLYRDLQSAGFQPDKVTYSIVMEVLGHCGYIEEAEALFGEMKLNNWIPDEPVYGLLVDLWGKSGNVDKAQSWYQAMLNAGLFPNVPTCNSLLSAFLRVQRFSDAQDMLLSMVRLGLNPSLQTYTLLLSCCTDTQLQSPRNNREMGFFFGLMAVTGHPAHSFLLSMPSPGPDGSNVRDHASTFLDLMHCEDRESKRGLIDAVIDFLHKSGLKEEAGSVWEVAAQKNVYPDAVREKGSSYWLINLHVMSNGTAITALSRTLAWFHREVLASGAGPSRVDIVTGWGRRSRVSGSSLVRESILNLLTAFRFPFFTENGNSGCFVGCGEPLSRWLLHSYVERMHLM
ncbi:hypothetical protein GIB67_004710 [Kingdonia uniflora]|uniref:Smr domain-containing protein n=1 Tax=Kingdonia uniflora TaxID=39325 RepID=A0A7J7P4X6_9MAGN|nr:hypothetical protein GIB67_004710 [Kingdonia uniflora]